MGSVSECLRVRREEKDEQGQIAFQETRIRNLRARNLLPLERSRVGSDHASGQTRYVTHPNVQLTISYTISMTTR